MNVPRFDTTRPTHMHASRLMHCARFALVVLVTLLALVPAPAGVAAEHAAPIAGPAASTGARQDMTDARTSTERDIARVASDDVQPIAPLTASFAPTTTQTFTGTASTHTFESSSIEEPLAARSGHTATRLQNGKVLIVGGYGAGSLPLASAKVYDPATGFFVATGSMLQARAHHTATLLSDGTVLIIGGYANDQLASAEAYDPDTGTFSATGSMLEARSGHTATLLDDGRVLVVGGYGANNDLASVEVYDPATGTFAPTGSMTRARSSHTTTPLDDGRVLVIGRDTSAEIYDPATGTFATTGSLLQERSGHTATLLPDGTVLVVGGSDDDGEIASAEVYDPATGTFAATGSLLKGRSTHTATLLPDGTVLIVGGSNYDDLNGDFDYLASAEVYNPATGTFSATGSMSQPRSGHTATLLPNGRVLVVGGLGDSRKLGLASAEVYNPATGTFANTNEITNPIPRVDHTATLLLDGSVLVVGSSVGSARASATRYYPAANHFVATGSMMEARYWHTATLLDDGRVLITGGEGKASAEVYDPATGTFTPTGSMTRARSRHTATLLDDGRVLVIGRDTSAEIYDPATGTFTPTGSLLQVRRGGHTATLLPDGTVLVAGGGNSVAEQQTAEIYNPATGTFAPTGSMSYQRYFHQAVLLRDGTVLIIGSQYDTFGRGEIYDPATGTFAITSSSNIGRLSNFTATLLEDGMVLLIGGYDKYLNTISVVEVYDPLTEQFARIGNSGERYRHTTTLLQDGTVLIVGGQREDGAAEVERGRVRITNTFNGTLTVPTGWNTTATPTITFTGSTTGTLLTAGSLNDGPWVPAQPDQPTVTTLPAATDGRDRPVVLRLRDANGVEVTVVRGTIDIDITAPSSTMTALGATSPATFTVTWSGTDATSGVATYDVEVREGSSGAWTPLVTNTTATSATFTGDQGNRYYFRVRARDVAGNVEAFPATYDTQTKIDTVAPIINSFQINRSFVNTSNALASTIRRVGLALDASDSQSTITEIRISQDGTFGPWQPYDDLESNLEVVFIELQGADGLKTVSVQVRDSVGNVSDIATDTIRLDTAAGTDYEVSINDGALWTNTLSVTLRIGAPGFTPEMRVSNDGGFTGAPWQPFDTRPEWTLTSFGSFTIPRTVYVRIRNESGQIQGIVQDDIIYDPLPPTGTITITELDASTVTVRLRATDQEQLSGVDEMRVSTDPSFADAEWQDTRVRVTLPRSSGDTVRVYAQWRDRAGNVSAIASDAEGSPEPSNVQVFLPSIAR